MKDGGPEFGPGSHHIDFSDYPAGTQCCFNVVLRLILGRDVKQLIFNVKTTLLISTSGK